MVKFIFNLKSELTNIQGFLIKWYLFMNDEHCFEQSNDCNRDSFPVSTFNQISFKVTFDIFSKINNRLIFTRYKTNTDPFLCKKMHFLQFLWKMIETISRSVNFTRINSITSNIYHYIRFYAAGSFISRIQEGPLLGRTDFWRGAPTSKHFFGNAYGSIDFTKKFNQIGPVAECHGHFEIFQNHLKNAKIEIQPYWM